MGEWKGVKLPRYVMKDKQRDGRTRWLFRRKGFPKATLPEPGKKTFWDAYAAAMHGIKPVKRSAMVKLATGSTFGWLCERYFESADFRSCDPSTQIEKKRNFRSMRAEPVTPGSQLLMEDCPIKSLNRTHVVMWRDRKQDSPTMANKRLEILRMLFTWAKDGGLLESNPEGPEKVKRLKVAKGGFYTWSQEEIERFEQTYQVGTSQRLFFALMLYTGMRVSDAVQLGPQHVKNGSIEKPQHKNRKRQGKVITVPMLKVLQDIIDASPTGQDTFFVTGKGEPYTIQSARGMFKVWCRRAGLPHCSPHGLRKYGAINAAHNGASESQLKAIFGWEGSHEVAIYTAMMERKKLAGQAMELIVHKSGTDG